MQTSESLTSFVSFLNFLSSHCFSSLVTSPTFPSQWLTRRCGNDEGNKVTHPNIYSLPISHPKISLIGISSKDDSLPTSCRWHPINDIFTLRVYGARAEEVCGTAV